MWQDDESVFVSLISDTMIIRRYSIALVIVFVPFAVIAQTVHDAQPIERPNPYSAWQDLTDRMAVLHHPRSVFRGSLSCSAVACHGGTQPGVASLRAQRGSEYPIWLENDPHARAALVLGNEQSTRILEHLQIMKDGVIVDQLGYANCQACHNAGHAATVNNRIVSSGNSCQSCHGPANDWIGRHHLRRWSRETGMKYGMLQTRDLLTRARMCADCHVGSRHREVNHDMIAAGHPPLRFEMASYHNRLPKHWRHENERHSDPEFQKQLWLAGQIAVADAALALLEARVDKTRSQSVWPEFAEYNCGGCHHGLRFKNARSSNASRTLIPTWGDWHYSFIKKIWAGEDADQGDAFVVSFGNLEDAMEKLGDLHPNDVQQLRVILNDWACERDLSELATSVEPTVREVLKTQTIQGGIDSWESAAQTYLSLVAVYAPTLRRSIEHTTFVESLRSMNRSLSRPQSQTTGGFFEPLTHPDPDTLRADKFRESLQQFFDSLP